METLYDSAQGLGLTATTLNYLYLAGLNKPVRWDGLGDLRMWFYWDLVDDPPKGVVPAYSLPEVAVPAHDPPEVVVPAQKAPEAAVPTYSSPEIGVPANETPKVAVAANYVPEMEAIPELFDCRIPAKVANKGIVLNFYPEPPWSVLPAPPWLSTGGQYRQELP